jgi:hypothetical protein
MFRLASALGISLGVTLLLIAGLGWTTGLGLPFIGAVGSLLRGYGPGPYSAVVGGVWGCALGFTFGAALAWIYNRVAIA